MILPYDVQKQVHDFFYDIDEYNIDCQFSELKYGRGKKNYERILKRLETANLPDPSLLKYKTLSTKEIKEYVVEIMCKIFGASYRERLEQYSRLIRIYPIDNYFDSIVETDLEGENQVPKRIYISNKCFSIQVLSTSHEYTHCLLSEYSTNLYNSVLNNVHYNELLPIIVEYIVCYELSKILKEEDLENKHHIVRISHDKDQAAERKEALLLDSKIRQVKSPDVEMIKAYIAYQEHNSFGYILSDIYAIHLLEIYKENHEFIISIIKAIIAGEKSINDLINYFNLSLGNIDIIKRYNQTIDQISLIKRK